MWRHFTDPDYKGSRWDSAQTVFFFFFFSLVGTSVYSGYWDQNDLVNFKLVINIEFMARTKKYKIPTFHARGFWGFEGS